MQGECHCDLRARQIKRLLWITFPVCHYGILTDVDLAGFDKGVEGVMMSATHQQRISESLILICGTELKHTLVWFVTCSA